MSCPVDSAVWGENNRVHLGTGKRQHWVLARTTRDAPTTTSIPATAKAVMVKWFAGTPLDVMFADAGDAVDDIEVLTVSETMPAPVAGAQRREALDPVPLLAAGNSPPLFVELAFNYRGYAPSAPWPVWTASASPLRSSKLCPVDCDWMLAWAAPPDALSAAPEEAGLLDKLAQNAPGPLAGLATLTQLLGYGLIAYVGFQAFSLVGGAKALSSARRRLSP